MEAIILAGGLGTRLRTAVSDLPKPMAPINGRPFLEYQLDYWITQGVSRFIFSVGYRSELIIAHFNHDYRGAKIDYAIESTPLGTGGGFLLATKKLQSESPFLLLNGDTYFVVELKTLQEFANENHADWCFALVNIDQADRYMGMDISSRGQVMSLHSSSSKLVNGGVYLIHPRAITNLSFQSATVSLETDILPAAVQSGQKLFGREFPKQFIDIGLPEDYHRAANFLAKVGK